MAERYVRPTVAGWLTATLIAPWISVYGAVTAFAALHIDHGLWGKVLGWTLGMLVGSAWAFVFCTLLVVVDLALLGVKVRTLPAGKRGWAYKFYAAGPWAVGAAVLVPMVVVAIVSRVFAGRKPLR
jgi:hypothetical protein